jgi:hypothetical protein
MTQYLGASHNDAALEDELRQAQVDSMLAREARRDAARRPQPDPQAATPSRPKVKVQAKKPAAKKATPPPQGATSQPVAQIPAATIATAESLLPPGARILSPAENTAVSHLLDWYTAVQQRASE